MNEAVERAGELGAEYVVVGMPHRGRLNVLANVARKPLEQIFREFRGGVHGTAVDDAEWRGIIMATFEQLCSEGRDGRLRAGELHGALQRLGVPASARDANGLMEQWAVKSGTKLGVDGVSLPEFQALTRSLLLPRSVSGDISHHLGMVNRRQLPCGRALELELLPNPSHLEAVNPLVSGRARAIQLRLGRELSRREAAPYSDSSDPSSDPGTPAGGGEVSSGRVASALSSARRRCVPLAVHGDAAFAAQGVVYETLGLSRLAGYTCGGTVHIIINNQIGFPPPPAQARSSRYCYHPNPNPNPNPNP